ncbi:MAG: hypothetical protein ABWW65_05130 [Thermoprotei archaeon]
MHRLRTREVDLPLILYFSYLLPLYKIETRNNTLIAIKEYGICKDLKCIYAGNELECIIPNNCSYEDFSILVGLKLKPLMDKLLRQASRRGFKPKILKKFTLPYSFHDKLYVFLSVYLSRNTDYYKNTVKWVKTLISNNCIKLPMKCSGFYKSYQYREALHILPWVVDILSTDLQPLREATALMKLKGVSIKTATAYLLHAYGLTRYAPIDRHYEKVLSRLGVSVYRPSTKKMCTKYSLNCKVCSLRDRCTYGILYNKLKHFNGLIQSIVYIYGRLELIHRHFVKPSSFEKQLLDFIDMEGFVIETTEFFYEILSEVLRY